MLVALDVARKVRPGIADAWIFADERGDLLGRHRVNDWWRRATVLAELPPVGRRGSHGLRRTFATDLPATPLQDLCQPGRCKSAATVLTCYQQADDKTMRVALEQRKLGRNAP